MITVTDLELRAGARALLQHVTFRVQPGDRIGLVGRNGAGKTTLTKTLAGETLPAGGTITRSGEIGYLPQDPRTGDLDVLARDRVLSARGLDEVLRGLEKMQVQLAERPDDEDLLRRYGNLEERFSALGGYSAESEAARICSSLGLPERALEQQIGTLSGGQRRRIELARILFSDATTLLLDEPTNHLDADSIVWLRGYLQRHAGGLVVISHDVELLDAVVNKVFHLDANRAELDQYNVGWKTYLKQRETDEKRRKRERANAEKTAGVLTAQAEKMRAKATKAKAAQGMLKRAEKLLAGAEGVRAQDRVAKLRFPEPAPCGKTPLTAKELSKSYGSLEIFTDVDLAIDRGARVVVLGLNGAGKTTLLKVLSGTELPDTGEVVPGPRAAARLLRAGARHPRHRPHGAGEHAHVEPRPARAGGPAGARLVPVHRRRRAPAGRDAVRRREDPARARHPGGQRGQRAAARRADQQPRPGEPRGGPQRAGDVQGRGGAGDPRRGRRDGAAAREGAHAAGRRRGPVVGRPGRPRVAGVAAVGLLDGKRLLATGVLTEASLASAVVRVAVEQGAEVLLTSPVCRGHRVTSRVAPRLGVTGDVLELDVTLPDDLAALEGAVRAAGWDRVDGVLHAVAYLPEPPGDFAATPWSAVGEVFQTAAWSLAALVHAVRPLLVPGSSVVGLELDPGRAERGQDWLGRRPRRARGHRPLPGPRPRAAGRARQPRRRRSAAHPAVQGAARPRRAGRRVGSPGAARLGRHRPDRGRSHRRGAAVGLAARDHRRGPARRRRRPRGGLARRRLASR